MKKYHIMVKHKSASAPIRLYMEDEERRAVESAKETRLFERVWVVNSTTGEIVWEQKKGKK